MRRRTKFPTKSCSFEGKGYDRRSGCLLKQAGQKSVLIQHFSSPFPRNSVPPSRENSVLFHYLQYWWNSKNLKKLNFSLKLYTIWASYNFVIAKIAKHKIYSGSSAEFPHFFSASGPPLKKQYYIFLDLPEIPVLKTLCSSEPSLCSLY